MRLSAFLSFLVLVLFFAAPFAVFADADHGFPPSRLVPECSVATRDATTGITTTTKPCGFADLMHLIRHLIDFAFFLAMPIAVCLFAWAGWLYLSSGGSQGKVDAAHKIFWSVGVGLFWVLGAWLVIKLISDALLNPDYVRLSN